MSNGLPDWCLTHGQMWGGHPDNGTAPCRIGMRPERFIQNPAAVTADLASRLGWLPCGECVDGWVFVEDVVPFQGGYMPTHGADACSNCNGVGWLPSPTVLEAMAEAIDNEIGNELREHLGHIMRKWPNTIEDLARAAWEAEARLILEGEK